MSEDWIEEDRGDTEQVVPDGQFEIARRLLSPTMPRGDYATLPALWKQTILTVTCRKPKVLENGFWMGHAVRGAWLNRLRELDGGTWPFSVPPIDALGGVHAKIGTNHIPPPYVVNVDRLEDVVEIRLRLFGWANLWRDVAFETMLDALEKGVSIAPSSGVRPPWEIIDAEWVQQSNFRTPDAPLEPSRMFLIFRTPLKLNAEGSARSFDRLPMSVLARIKGLARWQGYCIAEDNRSLAATCRGVRIEELPHSEWLSLVRRSSRGKGHTFEESGSLTVLALSNLTEELTTAFQLATTTNIGANADMDFGRFEVV